MNEEEDVKGGASDEEINQAYKEITDPKDPRTTEKFLEERAKKKAEEEKSLEPKESNIGATIRKGTFKAAESGLIGTALGMTGPAGKAAGGIITGGANILDIFFSPDKDGNLRLDPKIQDALPSISSMILDDRKFLPKDDTKGALPEGDETNFLSRIYSTGRSGNINLAILENLQAMISRTLTTTRTKRNPTPNKLRELLGKGTSGQQTLFSQMANSIITPEQAVQQETEEENNFNQKQYDIAKQFLFEEKIPQPFKVSKRDIRKLKQQARKPLKLLDVKKVQAKLNDPNITDEVVQNYFEDAKRSELGYGGTAGTIDFLNDMLDGPPGSLKKGFTSVDEFLANTSTGRGSFDDILEDMSFRLETPITKEKLQNLLDGTETYTFQTARMRKRGDDPIIINDAKSLTLAYFARLTALDDIGIFEKGHVNAVDQIVERFLNENSGITNTASFKDNTAPEIARSIYKLLGGEDNFDALFDEVRDYRVQGITDKDLKFAQVYAGNRTRKADQDLDRIVNSIFGTEPDLESSLLAYVYPEKSLNNLVASDMKVTFAKIFTKEFDELIQNVVDLGGKPENIGVSALQSFREQALRSAFDSIPPDLSKNMGKMLADYLRLNKIDVVDDKGDPKF